jgi:hypothetical protein
MACRVEKVCKEKHGKQAGSAGTCDVMDGEADIQGDDRMLIIRLSSTTS